MRWPIILFFLLVACCENSNNSRTIVSIPRLQNDSAVKWARFIPRKMKFSLSYSNSTCLSNDLSFHIRSRPTIYIPSHPSGQTWPLRGSWEPTGYFVRPGVSILWLYLPLLCGSATSITTERVVDPYSLLSLKSRGGVETRFLYIFWMPS